jgi:protein-disulfide isomerase
MTESKMKRAAKASTVLLPALVGLTASVMLLVDYLRPAPIFCDEGGGCDVIKHTPFSIFAGIPTPAFGVLGFVMFLVLALTRGQAARGLLLLVASIAAGVALFLLNVQRTYGVWCAFCVVVDVSTVLVGVAAAYRVKSKWDVPTKSPEVFTAAALAALAIAAPFVASTLTKTKLPDVIASELAETPKGKVTIIDFVDFECPWCRMTHETFSPIMEPVHDRIRVVRKQVPLPMHPNAMDAARAACCGEKLGKGDAMADALFKAEDLTPGGCEHIAEALGLSLEPYRQCVKDPSTDARIQADRATFKAAKGHGLPTIWIGDQKIEGAQPGENMRRALDAALARAGS